MCASAFHLASLSPHHRFVIALHSPGGVAETGLRVCPPEKNAGKLVSCRSEVVTGNSAGGNKIFPADMASVGGVGVDIAAEVGALSQERGGNAAWREHAIVH